MGELAERALSNALALCDGKEKASLQRVCMPTPTPANAPAIAARPPIVSCRLTATVILCACRARAGVVCGRREKAAMEVRLDRVFV
jgi:hypothetical protein